MDNLGLLPIESLLEMTQNLLHKTLDDYANLQKEYIGYLIAEKERIVETEKMNKLQEEVTEKREYLIKLQEKKIQELVEIITHKSDN